MRTMHDLPEGARYMSAQKKSFEPATCRHCDGEGCLYCNRTGTVLVTAPKTLCHHCDGVGCIYCGFTGWAGPKSRCD